MRKYSEIIDEFFKFNYWGLSTSIDIIDCNLDKIKDEDYVQKYIYELCDLLEMSLYHDSIIANFGIDEKINGISFMQLIETSSITGHFANFTKRAYIDIFSCKIYDPYAATEFTRKFFEGHVMDIHFVLRR